MSGDRASGFTLLEMLVALLLVGLILGLSVQLLAQVQITTLEWRRTLPDPVPQFAIQLLRSDIQRSRAVTGSPGSGPLLLQFPDESLVSYETGPGGLVRTVFNDAGQARGQRTLMRGLDFWSWRLVAQGLVEVQIVYRRHRDPGGRSLGGVGTLRQPELRAKTLTLRFAQRAHPARSIW